MHLKVVNENTLVVKIASYNVCNNRTVAVCIGLDVKLYVICRE